MNFTQCMRGTVILCNLLLFILGAVLLSVSVYAQLEPITQDYVHASGQQEALKISLYVLIVIGGFTVIAATVGFCGAYHESPCLLVTYFVILFLILCTEISIGVLGFVFKNDILSNTHQSLLDGVSAYQSAEAASTSNRRMMAQAYIDTIQRTLKCCGANGVEDYTDKIPESCCIHPNKGCAEPTNNNSNNFYSKGCTKDYQNFVKENMIYFFVTVICVCVLEFLCLLFSTILYCSARIESNYNYDGVPMMEF